MYIHSGTSLILGQKLSVLSHQKLVLLKTGLPGPLWLPQLVPPSPGGPGLGLEARAILISTYASHTDAGWNNYGARLPMV